MSNSKIKNILYKQKWLWIITIFALVVFMSILGFVIFKYSDLLYGALNIHRQSQVVKEEKNCENCVRRYIDGVYVRPGAENLFPVAVIIENHIDARPQSGLSKANLVYEAEVEGGITRFLAFYSGAENLEKIGPIRSARPYLADWTKEFSALLVHCGGSPDALVKIAKENIFNLNEFYNGKYFWRDKRISAPHNIFTSSGLLNEYIQEKNKGEGKFLSWEFKDGGDDKEFISEASELSSLSSADGNLKKNEITVNFQMADFMVKWKYNKENNDYIRYMGGQIHKDADGDEIRAKNVIIEYVKARVVDDKLRLKMEHIGEGNALVCLDGKCEEGEWRKKSSSARTRFYKADTDSEEFKFNAGAIWVEIVRPEYEINYYNPN